MYSHYDKKECTELHYNYRQAASDGREVFSEDWNTALVGASGVISINEHPAAGEGDKWFYDIVYENGRMERVFNPCRAFYNLTN